MSGNSSVHGSTGSTRTDFISDFPDEIIQDSDVLNAPPCYQPCTGCKSVFHDAQQQTAQEMSGFNSCHQYWINNSVGIERAFQILV